MSHHFLLLLIGAWFSAFALMHAESLNGFDISNASVPASEIISGGPPRDGIKQLADAGFQVRCGIAVSSPDNSAEIGNAQRQSERKSRAH